jgi:hypothetical protein
MQHGAPASSAREVEMGLSDDAVPGGNIAKTAMSIFGWITLG